MPTKKLAFWVILTALVSACGPSGKSSGTENNASELNTQERQYFSNGKGLYATHCANCHMEQGQGLGQLIPPLKNSDYLMKNVPAAARVIKYGLNGPIAVNGVAYDQPMPAHSQFTPLEIAEILTFVSNSWGNKHGGVTTAEVEKALAATPKN